ncbi:type IV pilin [Vibrio barjaei]|uniref:type IV pilus modification PilV family protein n=1 Tax=Vibrio barjaei TaxID=1676683 RepID=UPI002284A6F3|nr:type IV pilin [Vibrio barjaei]MCY9870900.1 type IV pilin [Vibrio barjaei]
MIFKQSGISIIEVLVALCLFGISALGLAKMQVDMERRSDFAYQSIQALGLAESKLEWFRTRGTDPAVSDQVVADYTTDIVDGQDRSHPLFDVKWTVSKVALNGSIKTVRVEVFWADRLGVKRNIALVTQISRFSEFD